MVESLGSKFFNRQIYMYKSEQHPLQIDNRRLFTITNLITSYNYKGKKNMSFKEYIVN